MKKFIDPNIPTKSKKIDQTFQYLPNTTIPLPSEVEISESGTCNRVCSFCPRSDPENKDIKEFISNDLHEKICLELKELNYMGTIRYSGFVEPLIDKNIYNLINMAKTHMPKSNIELVTNGDVLDKSRLKSSINEIYPK